jgi:hypothetical protein
MYRRIWRGIQELMQEVCTMNVKEAKINMNVKER